MVAGLTIPILIGRVIAILIGLTLHEFAHAWTAVRLGDTTPMFQRAPEYRMFGGRFTLGGRNRVTLDPRAHLEPMGTILAILVGFGWAHPVPVNPRAYYPHERRGLMIVAFAGPLVNLILAFVFGIFLRLCIEIGLFSGGSFLSDMLATIVIFNIVLFLFNLVPLPPLDGWKILMGLLPNEQAAELKRYEQEAMFALIFILMIGVINPNFNLIWLILGPIARLLFDVATGVAFF